MLTHLQALDPIELPFQVLHLHQVQNLAEPISDLRSVGVAIVSLHIEACFFDVADVVTLTAAEVDHGRSILAFVELDELVA